MDDPIPILPRIVPKFCSEGSHNDGAEDDQYLLNSGFQFVVENGLARPKGAVRELIRSQARRKKPNSSQNTPARRVTPLLPRRSNSNCNTNRSQGTPNLVSHQVDVDRSPTSNSYDPFNALPVDKRGNAYFILSQYNEIFYPNIAPYYSAVQSFTREDILHFTMSDPAVLHAVLGHIAINLRMFSGAKSRSDSTYHLGQAISLLNKRILNCNREDITDATIFAVGSLANLQITTGSLDSLKVHLDGLEALVKRKGGIQTLAEHPLILKFTSWVDNMCSITLGSKPRFELVIPAAYPEPVYPESYNPIGLRYKTKLSNLTKLDELSQQTVDAYYLLRYLVDEKDKLYWVPPPPGIRITKAEFQTRTDQLMRQLMNIVQYEIPESSKPNGLIYSLFGNAALTHAVAFVCKPSRLGSPVQLSVERIRSTLEAIDIPTFQIAYPEMMLWVFLVGGLASITTPHREFFVKVLADACLAAGISKATEELPVFLTGFMWSVFYVNPAAQGFWDDVFAAQVQAVEVETLGVGKS
ncbi:hypothetical protein N431DRAFT_559389 [Stipitochalara longipes BDJ]|nr:hypothetical protein N431DRAFT_559389 [Stipitochalara longipes BDJ]